MNNRDNLIDAFLLSCDLKEFQRQKLPKDASFRSYERVVAGDKSYILMDAPLEHNNIKPFIAIDQFLQKNNLNSPDIYNINYDNGFILLQDFGDNSYSSILKSDSNLEKEIYIKAIEVIVELTKCELQNDLQKYDKELLLKEVKLLPEWYLPTMLQGDELKKASEDYINIWDKLLDFTSCFAKTTVLRDYHADNLMWLESGQGLQKVGLLDFQDAVIGSPIYDLISLLEDARRDVGIDTVENCKEYFLKQMNFEDTQKFELEYNLLAAQRNCKIIGIFIRLNVRDGKEKYLQYLPRVCSHLKNDIQHEHLYDLKNWFNKYNITL